MEAVTDGGGVTDPRELIQEARDYRYWQSQWPKTLAMEVADALETALNERDEARAQVAILGKVEEAAREVDAFFDDARRGWKFDGRKLSDDAAIALLSLHGYLNDVEAARAGIVT